MMGVVAFCVFLVLEKMIASYYLTIHYSIFYAAELIVTALSIYYYQVKINIFTFDKSFILKSILCGVSGLIIAGMINFSSVPIPFGFDPESLIVIILIGPLVEELFFRVLFFNITNKLKNKAIIILNGVIFSLGHLIQLVDYPSMANFILIQSIYTLVLGGVLMYDYLENKSIGNIWFYHVAFNFGFMIAHVKSLGV